MKVYNVLYKDFNDMFMCSSALSTIISTCLGAVALMVTLMSGHGFFEMFQVFLIVVACMAYNTTVLAQLKHKIVFNSLIISLLISTLLIFVHLVFR